MHENMEVANYFQFLENSHDQNKSHVQEMIEECGTN